MRSTRTRPSTSESAQDRIQTPLVPLSGLLLDGLVGSASLPVAATCFGALWLSASGVETLRDVAVSFSGWKQGGKQQIQTTVFLLRRGLATYPDQVPSPGNAPTVMQNQLLDYARRGLLAEQDWGAEIRDQVSLNLQWRARVGGGGWMHPDGAGRIVHHEPWDNCNDHGAERVRLR